MTTFIFLNTDSLQVEKFLMLHSLLTGGWARGGGLADLYRLVNIT